MKVLVALLLSFAAFGACAQDQAASEASIRKLIEVTRTRQLLDGMVGQMDAMMQDSLKQAMGNATLTSEQQAVMDDMRSKILALAASEMKWESLEPDFIDIYRKTFTEEEVTGMLDFYRTRAGRALIAKMPLVMQHSMALMQKRIGVIVPKFQQIERETIEQMRACCSRGS